MKNSNRHRGMAYLMVMLALSVAGILGVATLTSTTLAVQAAATSRFATEAEFAAASGRQLALFGLQNPSSVPAGWSTVSGHVLFATNLPIGNSAGYCDIDAFSSATRDTYSLTITGRSGTDSTISRGIKSSAKLIRVKPTYAGVFGGAVTVYSNCSFTGSVLSNGSPTLTGSGTINGSTKTTIAATDFQIPTLTTINYFGAGASAGTYTMPDGVTSGTPEALAATISSFPSASATNPGHVFYRNGDLSISTTTAQTLNGTLVVRGNLTIAGLNGTVNITPVSRMPAVITAGSIKLSNKNLTVKLNGLVWPGGGIAWAAPSNGTSFQINGSLLLPSGATIASPALGALVVKYVAASVDVPDIATSAQPVSSVHVLSSTNF